MAEQQAGWPVARADGVVHEVVDGRAVLVDPVEPELVTLNPVGTLVWEALAEHGTPDAIADQLVPRFPDVPREELLEDVVAFLTELRAQGLVVERPRG